MTTEKIITRARYNNMISYVLIRSLYVSVDINIIYYYYIYVVSVFKFTVVRRRWYFDFCLLRVVHGRRGYGCRARTVCVQRLVVRRNVIAVRGNR